jgi:hypothetical protein
MNQYQRRLRNEPKVKVIAKAETHTANKAWLAVFAFAFFSFFYFFSDTLWRVLAGG